MAFNLRNRSFVKEIDFDTGELRFLLKLSEALKLAKYAGTCSRTLLRPNRARNCSVTDSSRMNRSSICSRYRAPASVSASARALRENSGRPSCVSSVLIWWLTADGVMQSSSAASAKLECLAAI